MGDYSFKKIHECFKRTLKFGSGKKIRPVAFCFVNNFLDSPCSGTHEASDEEERENRDIYSRYPAGSRCSSCPFLRSGEYISDALRILKTFGAVISQDDGDTGERRRNYFTNVCIESFFYPLLDRVKSRCYLTFDETDNRTVIKYIQGLSFNSMLTLIDQIDAFCKENDIK